MTKLLFRRCYPDCTSYYGFKYPKEGWVGAEDYNTKEECGGGIHALRIGDDLGRLNPSVSIKGLWQVFTDYEGLIELEGEVKIRKGFVRTGINISEYRDEFLKSPGWACWYALYVDKCASDETRKAACENPGDACWYALYVDKCASDETRKAACENPGDACWYALYVDKCASDETRKAACENPGDAWWYARYADKCARDDTRKSACRNPEWAYWYASEVDKCARNDTRQAAYKDPCWKKKYQEWEESLLKKRGLGTRILSGLKCMLCMLISVSETIQGKLPIRILVGKRNTKNRKKVF